MLPYRSNDLGCILGQRIANVVWKSPGAESKKVGRHSQKLCKQGNLFFSRQSISRLYVAQK
jgi:hypothetical protein